MPAAGLFVDTPLVRLPRPSLAIDVGGVGLFSCCHGTAGPAFRSPGAHAHRSPARRGPREFSPMGGWLPVLRRQSAPACDDLVAQGLAIGDAIDLTPPTAGSNWKSSRSPGHLDLAHARPYWRLRDRGRPPSFNRRIVTRGHPCTVGALLAAHDWRHQSSALGMHPFPTRGRKERT